jgi:hypothetical protein
MDINASGSLYFATFANESRRIRVPGRINEWDLITLIVSIPTGSVEIWASQQIEAQLKKFNQSLSDVSDDVVNRATDYMKEYCKTSALGNGSLRD